MWYAVHTFYVQVSVCICAVRYGYEGVLQTNAHGLSCMWRFCLWCVCLYILFGTFRECQLYVANLPVVDAVYEGMPCVPGMCTRMGVSQQQGTEQQAVLF